MFEEVSKNKIKSWVLISLFIIVIGALGWTIGYVYDAPGIGIIAIFFSLLYTAFAYYGGDNMILTMSGAVPASKTEYPHLVNSVEGLAIAAGIPAPKIYVINDSALNAFSTGRDPGHASITVTKGLLDKMDRQELEGVIAHEMSHIKNYDIRFMMLTVVLVGIITLISDFILRSFLWRKKDNNSRSEGGGLVVIFVIVGILLAVLSPFIGKLIQLAVSRQREFLADSNAVILTRYPIGLANALKKIKKDPDPLVDTANRATAHLFISTPFKENKSFITNIFSTHPPIEERIKRLEEM
ncbi:Protease HtpX [Candidatus Tiddalikarchaeum anstoanum]|nr:Protease HtpX [Candidatus Tiddalikarchaeum anstoanum]